MKIDSHIQFPEDLQPDRLGAKKATVTPSKTGGQTAGVSSPSGEDTVSLSGAHAEIARLSVAAQQVPDVRTERVSALQQQVRSGQFTPDTGKIADGLIAENTKAAKG